MKILDRLYEWSLTFYVMFFGVMLDLLAVHFLTWYEDHSRTLRALSICIVTTNQPILSFFQSTVHILLFCSVSYHCL
jgi:hypothetical protein